MDWYRIRVTRPDCQAGKADQLLADLLDVFQYTPPDSAAGVFGVQVEDHDVDIYISPALAANTVEILHRYSAVLSPAPPPTARHLIGSEDALYLSAADEKEP